MNGQNETERLLNALGALEGVRRVTRGWPSQPAEDALPTIVVQKTGESGVGWRDDLEYLTKLEYTVRVFAAQAAQADTLARGALQVMEELGYRRAFAWEESDGRVHQRLFRFQGCV